MKKNGADLFGTTAIRKLHRLDRNRGGRAIGVIVEPRALSAQLDEGSSLRAFVVEGPHFGWSQFQQWSNLRAHSDEFLATRTTHGLSPTKWVEIFSIIRRAVAAALALKGVPPRLGILHCSRGTDHDDAGEKSASTLKWRAI